MNADNPEMNESNQSLSVNYARLLASVTECVRSAQYAALKAVNTELVGLYWDIGRMIVVRQEGETWGKSIVQQLASDLQREFSGVGGFSASNLWRMKAFFESYQGIEKLAPLVREIGWSRPVLGDFSSWKMSLSCLSLVRRTSRREEVYSGTPDHQCSFPVTVWGM